MPHKENMIRSRKAMTLEAVMRTLIAIAALIIVLNIGKQIAEAAFGGGSDAAQSFENLANTMNSMGEGEKPFLLSLDEGQGIIGFGANSNEFKCYACPTAITPVLFYYYTEKPSNKECSSQSCVCLCSKGLTASQIIGDKSKVNCELYQCSTLNADIPAKISLESALKKKSQLPRYPYWDNGFFFTRRKGSDTPFNGMIPANDARKITAYIEKKIIGEKTFVGVCPELPCIQEQK